MDNQDKVLGAIVKIDRCNKKIQTIASTLQIGVNGADSRILGKELVEVLTTIGDSLTELRVATAGMTFANEIEKLKMTQSYLEDLLVEKGIIDGE